MKGREREGNEQTEAEARSSPSGLVIYKAILKEGVEELARPSSALFWSGLAAGLSMGGSLIAEGLLASHLPDATWKPLITKLGYSLGFVVVILGRQQLFTENTLTPILPLMSEKTLSRFAGVMRLWFVVLFANLLGCLAVAWVASRGAAFSGNVQREFVEIGRQAMEGSFGLHVTHGIFAGWLIALMVWLLPGAESARVSIVVIVTYLVGISRFNYIIAGSTTMFFLIVTKSISWGTYVTQFFIPTLLGNVIGGLSLVAALGHAQVVAGKEQR